MFENSYYRLGLDGGLRYELKGGGSLPLAYPRFQIEGEDSGAPAGMELTGREDLPDGRVRLRCRGTYLCGACLQLEALVHPETPFMRFRYTLSAQEPLRLTKPGGQEQVVYFSYEAPARAKEWEIRLSDYDFRMHSYALHELPAFCREPDAMGPLLVEEGECSFLTAYEHGSQYPDKFLSFFREGEKVALRAVKGNTWDGYRLDQEPYETIWFQVGGVPGDKEALAQAYRKFQLSYCSPNRESRNPYIFYNTWAFQERNKFYNHQAYLSSMNEERMLEEIDAAHDMGVDVFVIDTGWYEKTGDWEVDRTRFPRGLAPIRGKLEGYQMKLGLWFNPTVAAASSQMLKKHPKNVARRKGKKAEPFPIWETEESYPMCLVSDGMWEAFAGELIRLYRELGVTYFKWDAVDLYGCDSGEHLHGSPDTPEEERRDCYAFRIGTYLSKVVDKVCEACPQAIIDMDITECRRYFGLGFLSSSKFFAINNGPYFHDLDIQVPEDVWINTYVHPGQARPRVCRTTLAYDKWFPSVLMMAHYLPDDPEDSQLANLASLILGQNGIWGDLPAVSQEGRRLIHQVLTAYKEVREDITAADPVVLGYPGSALEVYEKIAEETGKGVVCLFGGCPGTFTYVLEHETCGAPLVFGPAEVLPAGEDGKGRIRVEFARPGAAVVLFR